MRITFHEVNQNMQYNIMKNYSKLSKLQEQIATGRQLNRPSDSPVDVTNDLALRGDLKALHQYGRNIDDGIAFMGVTDTSLVSMNDIMQRVKELALQGSNDTYGPEERRYMNDEVNHLLRQMVSLIDTRYKGEYIFGGTNNNVAPYSIENVSNAADTVTAPGVAQPIEDTTATPTITNVYDIIPGTVTVTDGGGTTYQENVDYTLDYVNGNITPLAGMGVAGAAFTISFEWVEKAAEANTDAIYREIEKGVTPQINMSADEVFYDNANNTNLVDAIVGFGEALRQNDGAGIRTAIDDLDNTFERILGAQATNGARINRFELTMARNETQIVEYTRLQSELEDADMAELITEFSLLENVYSASLQAGARVIQPSLVDFMN